MLLRRSPRASGHLLELCVVLVLFSVSVSYKLNVPSILLDYNRDLPSNFTIKVTGADSGDCFDWRSEDESFIKVSPLYDGPDGNCSQKAIISSIFEAGGRKVTRVSAFHKKNLDELVCEVITDVISTISIDSTSNELSVGGPPLMLKISARNKDGNVFTSINGLRITWRVTNSEETYESGIIKLSSSTKLYESSDDLEAWDIRGMLGYCVLAEAVIAGTVTVKATASTSKFTGVSGGRTIKVLPSIKIKPAPPIYMLKHDAFNLEFFDFDKGKPTKLSSMNFRRLVGEHTPIIGDSYPGIISKMFGSTEITLESTNNRYPDMTVDIHVVKPERLVIRISGGRFKDLEEMKTYTVAVEMYDSDNHLIHLSDYIRVVLTFPKKLFHVNFTTANGTYCNVQALVPGKGKIRAELKGVIERGDLISSKDILVATTEEVSVLQKIVIFPPDTFLPYERSIMPHKVLLKVTGGSGEYICAVSDSTVASIAVVSDTPYTVEVHVKNVTNLVVTITDRINLNNIAFAKISVQLVSDIEVYPTVVEAEVNNFVVLPVALVGNDGSKAGSSRKFDDCSQTRPIVEIIEKHILNHTYDSQVPSYGKGCMNLVFECKYPGYSRVNIMYQSNENTTNNTTFKTTTVMACFKRLTAVHPVRVAVLALGTSKEVAFEGGPRKWPLFKDGHFTKLEPANDGLLDISLIKDPVRYNKDLTVFRVLCKGLGESDLTFKIGNVQSATNPHPAQSEAQIKIFCSEPSTIHLKNAVNTVGKKLKDESIVKVPFYGDKGFSVDVWLKDSVGRKFANISVFEIEWEVSDKTLAEPNDGLSTHENAVAGYRKITRDFKEFKLKGGTGKLEVRAKVLKYKSDYLSKEGIVKYKNIKEISNSIVLNLVSLRDIHDNLYATDATDNKEKQEGGHCDKDSC